MDFRSKLIYSINKRLNEELNIDDFEDSEIKILKKSLQNSILKSLMHDKYNYYHDKMYEIAERGFNAETVHKIQYLCKTYGFKYQHDLDGSDFKEFILMLIKIDPNMNLNWIDTSEVTNMKGLFSTYLEVFPPETIIFNGDISEWDVSNVKTMQGMFCRCTFNGDISKWDVSSVTDMEDMFHGSDFNGDISLWDVSNVENMNGMFASTTAFDQDISNWDVSSVTDMCNMFLEAQAFYKNISNWKVSSKTRHADMFDGSIIRLYLRPKAFLTKKEKEKLAEIRTKRNV